MLVAGGHHRLTQPAMRAIPHLHPRTVRIPQSHQVLELNLVQGLEEQPRGHRIDRLSGLAFHSVCICDLLRVCAPHVRSFPPLSCRYLGDRIDRWVSLLSRVLVTGWSVFALVRTALNIGLYKTLYGSTVSPCNIDIFDDYLSFRLGWVVRRAPFHMNVH